jgi:molybdopterin molybdotransferase
MVVSTGDELVEPGEPIAEYQVRRSNAYAIAAALRARGFERVGNDHVDDDAAQLKERLQLHMATHDVLILSGGVSMGRFDLVPATLMSLGVREIFHRVAQRPGKPLWFGIGPQGQAVFGLPGNPVSTLVCLARYVFPAVSAAMGTALPGEEKVPLGSVVSTNLPLASFMPVRLEADEWGRPWANPQPTNTSGDYLSLGNTTGFMELPQGPANYERGFLGTLYRW